jgi:hypothetical protein
MYSTGIKGSAEWWKTVLDRLGAPLGYDAGSGATPEQLAGMETRLGRPVSAAFKALLQTSNGFPHLSRRVGRVLASTEVDWFRNRHPEQARAIEELMTSEKVNRRPFSDPKWTVDIPLYAIEIAEPSGGVTLLLHPRRGRGGGEWDVWLVKPGAATRFPTLADFAEYEMRS